VRVKRITSEANVFHLLENGLLEFIDELQISFGDVHNEISKTWFGYEDIESEDNFLVTETKSSAPSAKPKAKSGKAEKKVKKQFVTKAKTKLSVSTKNKTKKAKAGKTKKKKVQKK
ncbi:MAG: hypothetical protein P8M72_12310, partial [Gammaproteobacteria bacterium]|nr:hypothetical protein [Gammaproteobacteria bacterium]